MSVWQIAIGVLVLCVVRALQILPRGKRSWPRKQRKQDERCSIGIFLGSGGRICASQAVRTTYLQLHHRRPYRRNDAASQELGPQPVLSSNIHLLHRRLDESDCCRNARGGAHTVAEWHPPRRLHAFGATASEKGRSTFTVFCDDIGTDSRIRCVASGHAASPWRTTTSSTGFRISWSCRFRHVGAAQSWTWYPFRCATHQRPWDMRSHRDRLLYRQGELKQAPRLRCGS